MKNVKNIETDKSGSISFFKRIKIGSRLLILLVVLIMISLSIGGLGYYGLSTADNAIEAIYKDRLIPTRQLASIDDLLMGMLIEIYRAQKHDPKVPESKYHNSTHTKFKHLNIVKKNIVKANKIWKKYMATYLTPEEKKLSLNFNQKRKLYFSGIEKVMSAIENNKYNKIYKYAAVDLSVLYHKSEASGEKLRDIQAKIAREIADEADSTSNTLYIIIISSIVAAVLIAIVFGSFIVRSITGPVGEVISRIRDIAEGEGDLTKRVEINTKDELADVALWVNRFIEKVQGIVRQISGSTQNIANSSNELNESSQNLSAGTEEMSQQSVNISSASTQMNQNLQVVSSAVEEMATAIAEVAKQAGDAAGISEKANRSAGETNSTIQELGASAKEIGKVIDSIADMADQTNLLALNAAIEAAGAGDAGKGFAVVASEVKELARQSSEASEEIKERIQGIQNITDKSVEAIANISSIISQLNEINSTIASSVEEQSITTKEIAGNVEQSSAASTEVSQNIEGISAAARDGAKDARKANDLAKGMSNLSEELKELVAQFKI